MNFVFSDKVNNFLKIILKTADKQNISVYFVGGIVRDNVLGIKTRDIDLIINSNAIEFAKHLPDEISVKSVHKDFATVKAVYQDIEIDIASTRCEKYPYSACLPVVDKIGVDISLDYLRRDFTVNSMYAKIGLFEGNLSYELIDFANGIDDINKKTLRVLHDKSYIDDPTRILRGLDFKYRFGFDFSPLDKKLICDYINNPMLENASRDRIISVFKKTVNKNNFREIIENKYYKLINNADLDIDFELINNMKIGFDSDFYLKVILNNEIKKIDFKDDLDIIKEFSRYSASELAYYLYKTKDENIKRFLKIKDIKLYTNGDDLISLGYQKGKNIGEILKTLLSEKIKNPSEISSKEDEINLLKKLFPRN